MNGIRRIIAGFLLCIGAGDVMRAEPTPNLGSTDMPLNVAADSVEKPAPKQAAAEPVSEGPLFRIRGSAAVAYAKAAGYHFRPAGGFRDPQTGNMVAQSHSNAITSSMEGHRITQQPPLAGWTLPQISNVFYWFVDAKLRPAPLAKGWKLRGIQLTGSNWVWGARPQSGAPSASFAVQVIGFKNQPASTVELASLLLEGPPGAKDWRAAFSGH
jgi:hypothetical protein